MLLLNEKELRQWRASTLNSQLLGRTPHDIHKQLLHDTMLNTLMDHEQRPKQLVHAYFSRHPKT